MLLPGQNLIHFFLKLVEQFKNPTDTGRAFVERIYIFQNSK